MHYVCTQVAAETHIIRSEHISGWDAAAVDHVHQIEQPNCPPEIRYGARTKVQGPCATRHHPHHRTVSHGEFLVATSWIIG